MNPLVVLGVVGAGYALTRAGKSSLPVLGTAEPNQVWTLVFSVANPPAQMQEMDAWFRRAGIEGSGTILGITGTPQMPAYTVGFTRETALRPWSFSVPMVTVGQSGERVITLRSAVRAPIGAA